jgi:putative adenylate-forming enzyme
VNAVLLARILWERRRLRAHERWSRSQLEAFQARRLAELRRHAYARSSFYRRFHRGLESRPLAELPVLTKGELMTEFDELVTAPQVRLAEVERHLAALESNQRFLGRFWVSRTSGSTGHPGVFLVDAREWATVIASYARAQEWAGIEAGPTHRTRLAVVSSRVPWHQSARVGMSVDNPFLPVRRFDATQPLSEIVAGLNAWQPANLVAYASMARVLAGEQLAGRLRISPRAVMCSSEVLTEEAAARIERAWGSRPFNVYAATETAGVASECGLHRMHLYEDLVIPEVVDELNRPVPPGSLGAKLLVSVLWSRTQPLIRYEMSDCVSFSTERCECGLPFGLLSAIEGRAEDSLVFSNQAGGDVVIHPNVFHRLLEPLPLREYQVVQEAHRLRILLSRPVGPIEVERLAESVTRDLRAAGAEPPPVEVEIVDAVPRTRLGKAPLVKALRVAPAP